MWHYRDRIMRRCIPHVIVALLAGAMILLLAPPSYAQVEGDYAGYGEDYYGYGDGAEPPPLPRNEDRPYVAYGLSTHAKPEYSTADHTYTVDNGYAPPRYTDAGSRYHGGDGYLPPRRYDAPPYYAYRYGNAYKKRYPRWRKTCVYGPLREKKVCDYEPRHCWKERECYYVYGKKYCRYYTKCRGGGQSCRWIRKRAYGAHSCGEAY